MRRSRWEPGLWTPGVSTKTICAAGCTPFFASTSTTPAIRLRVVCGLAETMATFSPVRALSSVLLPALGRPRIATNPDFNGTRLLIHYYRGLMCRRLKSSAHDFKRLDKTAGSALARVCGSPYLRVLGPRVYWEVPPHANPV